MATPDPYQSWSGAPKHWVHVPAQRDSSPAPDELDTAAAEDGVRRERARVSRGGWAAIAIAIAVALVAFVLIGSAIPLR